MFGELYGKPTVSNDNLLKKFLKDGGIANHSEYKIINEKHHKYCTQ